jgi:DNA-binding GntR family transcriptional regulator
MPRFGMTEMNDDIDPVEDAVLDTMGKSKSRLGKSSLGEFVRDQVRAGIQSGHFAPGDRMRENDIAEWLGVSRTPVREALRHLESEGLLMFLPWSGVVVAELDSQQVVELYKVRASLEGLAASLAAQHISDTELLLLEALITRGGQADDPAELAHINKRFHETIYAACHNRYLIQNLRGLQSALALLKGTTYSHEGRREQADIEHRALFEAIRNRDSEAADRLSREHMKGAEIARLKMMSALT